MQEFNYHFFQKRHDAVFSLDLILYYDFLLNQKFLVTENWGNSFEKSPLSFCDDRYSPQRHSVSECRCPCENRPKQSVMVVLQFPCKVLSKICQKSSYWPFGTIPAGAWMFIGIYLIMYSIMDDDAPMSIVPKARNGFLKPCFWHSSKMDVCRSSDSFQIQNLGTVWKQFHISLTIQFVNSPR